MGFPLQSPVCRKIEDPAGVLTYRVKAFAPNRPAPDLPDAEYILLDSLEASPRGQKLLQKHASAVIADIRELFGNVRKIILQPANFTTQEEEERLEAYYRKCGFTALPTSPSGFWMTWAQ